MTPLGNALRNLVRRNEALTRGAVRTAGRLQSIRDRGLTRGERWRRRSSDESRYWLEALAADDATERFADRLDPEAEVTGSVLRKALDEIPETAVRILDVGSGPMTSVGKTYPGKQLEVLATDALADEYVRIIREAGIDAPVLPVACSGEELLDLYEPGSFDIVHCANALDHTADPLLVLDNMLALAGEDGLVALWHMRNEGERNQYFGIHFWNIDLEDGSLVFWNRDARHDINERLRESRQVESWSDGERVSTLIRSRR